MGFLHLIESSRVGRAVERAGRVTDRSFAGPKHRKGSAPARLSEPTPEQRAAGRARVLALFNEVPVVAPDAFAPSPRP